MNSDSLIRLQDTSAPVLDLAFGVLGASVDTVDDITVNVEFNAEDLYQAALKLLKRD